MAFHSAEMRLPHFLTRHSIYPSMHNITLRMWADKLDQHP